MINTCYILKLGYAKLMILLNRKRTDKISNKNRSTIFCINKIYG